MSTNPTPTTPPSIPVAILVRVSTDKQNNERQIYDLQQVAASRNWEVIEIIEEQISGAKQKDLRAGLDRALTLARAKTIQKVLVHEISRVARRNSIAHDFIEQLEEVGVSLYWNAQGMEMLLPSGKRNPAAGAMFAILAEFARAERENLQERIMSGLAKARRNGVTLGRPKGTGISKEILLMNHADITKLLRAGKMSIRQIAKQVEKAPGTVLMVKKLMATTAA